MRFLDIFNKEVMETYQVDQPLVLSRFWQTGAFASSDKLTTLLNSGSRTFQVPHINPIDMNVESAYGNTILTDILMPRSISGYVTGGRASYLTDAFSESRLETFLTGESALQKITQMLDNNWRVQAEIRAIATLFGLRNADTAKKYTFDISKATATAASKFSVAAFIEVEGTMPEDWQGTGMMAIHPEVATSLRLQGALEKFQPSADTKPVTLYNGREIVQSRRGTKVGNGANAQYITYLLGAGAFAADLVRGYDDLELERTAGTGNGAGHNILYTRANTLIHPQGFSFTATDNDLTGGTEAEALSASWADLENGDYWRFDADIDSINMRIMVHNI